MRTILALAFAAVTALPTAAVAQTAAGRSWTADNGNGTYTNPLFYDEFSDPDILRVGDDYYLAGTTMHSVPGVNILHSRDLVNWEQWSYCFDRFDFDDPAFSLKDGREVYGQGIWAPAIRYHNGKFYVFSNVNGKGLQVFTADDARGPWKHHNMKGNIYDLSVLFDDDGRVYAIHGYGEVKCTQLKDDLSEPIYSTERTIIPEGSGVGEGHHMYKINGWYYLVSTDYKPNGRTLCSRSKSIWGPYETITIEADETFGYHAAPLTQWRGRIVDDGSKFTIPQVDPAATANSNAHQGGIVSTPDGQWWALLMQDFHSIGRTVDLLPVTWQDGWPMIGLPGNPGRSPRTWLKPSVRDSATVKPHAPYERNENFDGRSLGRVWQWNHNPDDSQWSLRGGRLRLNSMPAKQLMWARNTLTQRVIGPKSLTTVELYPRAMKEGDVAGLGNINVPCSWIGLVRDKAGFTLQCFVQADNDTVRLATFKTAPKKVWLRLDGDFDNDLAQWQYSLDGLTFVNAGPVMRLSYQLCTFQGSRTALFCFNHEGRNGGYAEFDNFTVDETMADRSGNIPYGRIVTITNLGSGRLMNATPHGPLHDAAAGDKSPQSRFRMIDRGRGQVVLQCADGRYVMCSGWGIPGDVRMTADSARAEVFMYQDFLDHEFMLMSMRTHQYLGKSPTTGSPYSMDYHGADPARHNGAVLRWDAITENYNR